MRAWITLIALCVSAPALAQVYRWTDDKGVVHYSNSAPPPGVSARRIETDVKPTPEEPGSEKCYTIRCQGERLDERIARRDELDARSAAERTANAPRQARGLTFSRYISIQRGMTEGELLGIAGEPDLSSSDGVAYDAPVTVQGGRQVRRSATGAFAVRTYTYLPTPSDPFTTTITLVGGRVSELDRVRKF